MLINRFQEGFHCLLLQLFTFPVLQQFGLLFRERLESIGLTTAEITTIINLNPCITSCAGEQCNKILQCNYKITCDDSSARTLARDYFVIFYLAR